ncbi:MAG: hypothetical protein DMG08_24050 [Acidobacteria bacterium]|nr:MAG: hypothetical protein DMG08_24050 [Acidobacteriota bacterium]
MDLVCLGELLIDFVATAPGPLRTAPGFVKAAGGAPANVAVAGSRLGLRTGFIGTAGKDDFGFFLKEELQKNGVDVRGLHLSSKGRTPLAFVSLKESAERDFLFYWQNTADHFMSVKEIPLSMVRSSKVFHYGSISLIHPASRRVTQAALRCALGSNNTLVSCDPNVRLNLWPSSHRARATILKTIETAHLVKINEEELKFLTRKRDLFSGIHAMSRFTDAAILVTRGVRGAAFRWSDSEGEVPAFPVAAIDSTGAGDGFVAGFLNQMIAIPGNLRKLRPCTETLTRWVRYANAVGALATTRRGAIPAFPTPGEVANLLKSDHATLPRSRQGILDTSRSKRGDPRSTDPPRTRNDK